MKILLIVPPFGPIEFQSLGLHNLQALGRLNGFEVDILYANIHFASQIGEKYNSLCNMNYFLLGERIFARSAWGCSVDSLLNQEIYNYTTVYNRDENPVRFFPKTDEVKISRLIEYEKIAYNWIDSFVENFLESHYDIVGVTSSFEQTNAAVSILKKVKQKQPNVITIFGGFNCEGDGADGIKSLDPGNKFINYIFSGESELTFISFLNKIRVDGYYSNRIIYGKPLEDLDLIPNLDYSDYFDALDKFLPNKSRSNINLVMETSRGCWWGEKNQCKFCGTSERICYRVKSEERVLKELTSMKKWGVNYIHMADLIMPQRYKNGLLDKIINRNDAWKIYYEQKVSLSYNDLKLLKKAGITEIQPGIESLSSEILKKMSKGTDLKQNIKFLRDVTDIDINLYWNIVWGIPGEKITHYKEINRLIPLISHLIPPIGMFHMTLLKFSPYFKDPNQYGIYNIRPLDSYNKVFPEWVDRKKIGIIFSCDYDYETKEDDNEIKILLENINNWNNCWFRSFNRPRLHICRKGDGETILLDTRGVANLNIQTLISPEKIKLLINNDKFNNTELQLWALKYSYAILDGDNFIPLPTIEDELRIRYED
ncbi:RiPP maturation radical SAM C-methyltransferase [Thiospirochaeta perfilievii]|uniref:RiPP maturation radical SAM C-methyltransferase n=1 Tax=Thiospirochaeta perfilievii TaxID=252967 RepID=UPI001658CE73|nr:RiPP maturation radical SAM C-methyltransferase [Thiospirochaeta perfilievii]